MIFGLHVEVYACEILSKVEVIRTRGLELVGERCVDVLVIFRRKLAKIGDFSNGNEILRVKEAAQLDEIWCACRSICLLDSLKIWRHLVKGSRRGDREKSGFLLIFSRKWGKSVISHTETLI